MLLSVSVVNDPQQLSKMCCRQWEVEFIWRQAGSIQIRFGGPGFSCIRKGVLFGENLFLCGREHRVSGVFKRRQEIAAKFEEEIEFVFQTGQETMRSEKTSTRFAGLKKKDRKKREV